MDHDAPAGLAELRNLGPASARLLGAVGVSSPAELERLGSAEVFRRLRDAHLPGVSRNLLWAMEGALLGIDWRELPPELRDELLAQVDESRG